MKRTALKRTSSLRRSPMRPSKRRSKYARRPRNLAYLCWVKTQPCSAWQEWPNPDVHPGDCHHVIEADHDSSGRGLSQKSDDMRAIPLCLVHHRQRTDHTGAWKHVDKARAREWFAAAVRRTQTNWDEEHEDNAPHDAAEGA